MWVENSYCVHLLIYCEMHISSGIHLFLNLLNFQQTLPTFPSASQSQLKLLNMGSNQVTVTLPGNDPLLLPAAQVCPHTIRQNVGTYTSLKFCENQIHASQNTTVYAHIFVPQWLHCFNTFSLQASDEFFTFDQEIIRVSIGSPEETKYIPLAKEKRQTLLIPSNIADEWLLVS